MVILASQDLLRENKKKNAATILALNLGPQPFRSDTALWVSEARDTFGILKLSFVTFFAGFFLFCFHVVKTVMPILPLLRVSANLLKSRMVELEVEFFL